MPYILIDAQDKFNEDGYAYCCPIEGWIFSILPGQAKRFSTKAEAETCNKEMYRGRNKFIVVQFVEK